MSSLPAPRIDEDSYDIIEHGGVADLAERRGLWIGDEAHADLTSPASSAKPSNGCPTLSTPPVRTGQPARHRRGHRRQRRTSPAAFRRGLTPPSAGLVVGHRISIFDKGFRHRAGVVAAAAGDTRGRRQQPGRPRPPVPGLLAAIRVASARVSVPRPCRLPLARRTRRGVGRGHRIFPFAVRVFFMMWARATLAVGDRRAAGRKATGTGEAPRGGLGDPAGSGAPARRGRRPRQLGLRRGTPDGVWRPAPRSRPAGAASAAHVRAGAARAPRRRSRGLRRGHR